MIYRKRSKNSRFYESTDGFNHTKEEWLEQDPNAKFINSLEELAEEAHLTSKEDGSNSVNKDGEGGQGILHMYIPPEQFENKPSSYDLSSSCHQVVYKWGDISTPFDDYMQSNPEAHNPKDVARICQTTFDNRAFVNLLYRRVHIDKKVKRLPSGKIQWVNNDWKSFLVDKEAGKRLLLNLALPFGAEKYIATPEKVQIAVGGDIGSGKTHYGYMIAELNLGKLPIRHFIVEDGDQRSAMLLDDYPLLKKAFYAGDQDYYLINPSKLGGLDIIESLDPYGINIYDYYRLRNSNNWYLDLQHTLVQASDKLETGAVIVMLQKGEGKALPYGKEFSKMQCEVCFVLHKDKNVTQDERDYGHKECHITIEKARSWATKQNPEVLACGYRTAPLHGKLIPDSKGWIRRENWDK